MEVSDKTTGGLAAMADFPDKAFKALVKTTLMNACGEDAKGVATPRKDLKNVEALSEIDPILVKGAHLALTKFIVEAAKTDVPPSQIASALEEAKLSEDRVKTVMTMFDQCKPILRKVLSRNKTSFPQLLRTEWRLDHHMRSRSIEQLREPVYMLKLHVYDPSIGAEREIQMTCNHQELSDLHAQIKGATTRVEKMVRAKK
mmetsp:Transcript_17568/g.24393  ORF Transcript_17568/g.24393 Transcript_17568/m.24393 type:complete len:201 (-) Transcript_17568:30-632(-)